MERKIAKHPFERTLIFVILGYMLAFGFLCKNFGLKESLGYGIDLLLAVLFFFKWKRSKRNYRMAITGLILSLMMLSAVFGIIMNHVSPVNVYLGIRGQFMTIVFFYPCASYLTMKDYHRIFHYFFYFQIVNLTCCLYQYFILDFHQDFNNGAFLNGATQDFFCGIISVYYYYMYTRRRCSLQKFFFVFFSCLIIAVIEEEKFIFFELAILFLYSTVMSGFHLTRYIISGVVFIGMSYAIYYSGEINGEYSTEVLSSFDNMLEYSQMTGAGYELPRIGSSVVISNMFFHSPFEYLFGLGLGNCEDTKLALANTDFLSRYGWLHYSYFTFQITLLQTGFIGVILYLAFFTSLLFHSISMRLKRKKNVYIYDIAIVATVICIATIWYNSTLRVANGVIPYFVMAMPFVMTRELIENEHLIKYA